MKLRVLVHTPVTPGCETWEASKYLLKIAQELKHMRYLNRPQRFGIKDINGQSIGFWSIQKN